jgi:O-antigen ligase
MTFTPDLPVRVWQAGIAVAALGVGVLAGIDPVRSALAAAALAVMLVVLGDLTLGLCLFAFLAFLDYHYPNIATLFVLALAMSWLGAVTAGGQRAREFVSTHPAATWLISLLPAWAAMSLLWAEVAPPATSAAAKYAVNGALFLIVYTAVKTRRHVVLVLGAFVLSAAFSAAYGLVAPAEATGYSDDLERVSGPIGDPNALARVLVAGLVLAFLLAVIDVLSPVKRLIAASAAFLCAAGLVLTASRGGLIALVCAFVAALVFSGRWRPQVTVLVLAVGLLGAGYYAGIASPDARERITATDGGSGRTDLWRVGWQVVEDKPMLGAGAGNFGELPGGCRPPAPKRPDHQHLERAAQHLPGDAGRARHRRLMPSSDDSWVLPRLPRAGRENVDASERRDHGDPCSRTARGAGGHPGRGLLHLRALQQAPLAAAGAVPGGPGRCSGSLGSGSGGPRLERDRRPAAGARALLSPSIGGSPVSRRGPVRGDTGLLRSPPSTVVYVRRWSRRATREFGP